MDVAPPAVLIQLREIRRSPSATAGTFTHRLVSRRMMKVYNSTGAQLPSLRRRRPYNPAFLHPDDLAALGVKAGDVVRIESAHDFIYAVAEPATDLRPGVVSMAHAHGGAPERDAGSVPAGSAPNNRTARSDTEREFSGADLRDVRARSANPGPGAPGRQVDPASARGYASSPFRLRARDRSPST
jgi:anaerobic selenocysteine-containing dehydrogenase